MTIRSSAALVAALALLAAAAGCASQGSRNSPQPMTAAQSGGVLDVAPSPAPSAAPPPAPAPAPVASNVYDSTQTQAAPAPVTVTPTGGGSYTVQKGDTLWKIATTHYGDGKQWQKICSANPGLTPETLKAGQTITIP